MFQEIYNFHGQLLEGCDHTIGGEEPDLCEPWEAWANTCPVCCCEMQFVAMFNDTNLDPRGFADTGCLQVVFTYCRDCHVVGASNLE